MSHAHLLLQGEQTLRPLIARGLPAFILAVLAQVAEMERRRIAERTASGRQVARETLKATGKTHKGKESLGRPFVADAAAVKAWRKANSASITQTAHQFGLSQATVKRYCAGT